MSGCKRKKKTITKQLTVSCLEKVFPLEKPKLLQSEYSAFKNETFHYQVCCYTSKFAIDAKISVESDLGDCVSIRAVDPVPARFAVYEGMADDYYIKGHGNNEMYPDLLRPIHENGGETLRPKQWTAFWVTVDGSKGLPVGTHTIKVRVYGDTYKEYDKSTVFTLNVLDAELPESDLTYTNWMHYDSICVWHGVEPFTDAFYDITAKYVQSAVKHGMNMLYTPIFTPALDVAVGKYRKTVQLVKIQFDGAQYSFDFSEVKRFFEFALSLGIKCFEISHLCTQWGAKFCPKVVADVNGEEKRIFGWDVSSTSEEYGVFLDAFLSEFAAFALENGYTDKLYFHIADETEAASMDKFRFVYDRINKYFPSAHIMDAFDGNKEVGEYLTNPVIALNDYHKNPCKWVYYGGACRTDRMSNRLLAMPLQRARILGLQMYRNGSTGCLHWGFNFYSCTLSHFYLDPYFITDAAGYFDAGDSFIVYPTKDGVYDSIRHEAFYDGFQDYRAMKLLESLVGKEQAVQFLADNKVKEGYLNGYPPSAKWHLKFRKKLNKQIMMSKCKL